MACFSSADAVLVWQARRLMLRALNSTSCSRYSIYLLYWHKSTNADAEGAAADAARALKQQQVLDLLALQV
jgi:hypothetical protein